ncbi:MAG: hypothetical protein H7A25_17005 [Leptospiraceae bacterium]|nr:hypothetical protein [Leptospiraceae bacterium]
MPATLNIGVNQIIELILQLPEDEKKTLFMELNKFSELQLLFEEFLVLGQSIPLSMDDISKEVESYRQEKFV